MRPEVPIIGAALALVCGGRHYGWELVPAQHAAQFWNIAGAVSILALSFLWGLLARSVAVWLIWLALAWHELAVVICSLAYIVKPWPIPGGVGQCSAWAHADLSKLGALLLLLCTAPLVSSITRERQM